MLQAGEVVDADAVGYRHIAFSVGASVNERGGAAPILVGSVGEENFGHDVFFCGEIEQSAGFLGHGIFLGQIGERESVGWEVDGRGGLRVARGLSEAVVEAAAAGASHMSQHAVERPAAFLVRVEALIEKGAKETPVL